MAVCDVTLLYSAYATPEHNAHIERFFRKRQIAPT